MAPIQLFPFPVVSHFCRKTPDLHVSCTRRKEWWVKEIRVSWISSEIWKHPPLVLCLLCVMSGFTTFAPPHRGQAWRMFPLTLGEAWWSVVLLVCSTWGPQWWSRRPDGVCMLGGGQEIEKATQTMVVSSGLGPGCWVLSDPNSTSYLFLWSASYSVLIWGERQERQGSFGRKVALLSALFQVTVLD